MKILISANAPFVGSGYGKPAKYLANYLHDLGHEVTIYGWFGLAGAAINVGPITVLPRLGPARYGQDAFLWAEHISADVLITIEDIWVLPSDFQDMLPKTCEWIPWFPVDGEPLSPQVKARASLTPYGACYSRWGTDLLTEAGVVARHIPIGVDTEIFHPLDRDEIRPKHGLKEDDFLVTMVAANKGWPSRKAFPEALQAFKIFSERHDNARLYLHTEVMGVEGLDMGTLIDTVGLTKEKVTFADQLDIRVGFNDEHMARLYNASDVLMSPSMGEGFGIPILEAQACGTPVITQDCTSMTELTWNGVAIPRGVPFYTPAGHYQYLPDVGQIVDALEWAYAQERYTRRQQAAIKLIKEHYDWRSIVVNHWLPLLYYVENGIEPEVLVNRATNEINLSLPVETQGNGAGQRNEVRLRKPKLLHRDQRLRE